MRMAADFSFDIFLSHNAEDKPRVRRLAELLRARGLRIWFDEWVIKPGDDIYLSIERGLGAARTLVLCLSSAALKSDWVGLERSTALFRDPSNVDRRFIPLLLDDCELPDALRRYKYVDFRQEADAAFEELLTACGFTKEGATASERDTPQIDAKIPPAVSSLLKEGWKFKAEGRYVEARRAFESAQQLAEVDNCSAALREARIYIAETDILEQRDVAAARDTLLTCLRELKEDKATPLRREIFNSLGDAEILLGNVEEAKSLYNKARQLAQQQNKRGTEAYSLMGLGHAEELLGNLDTAHRLLDESIELYRAEHREAPAEDRLRTATNLAASLSSKAIVYRHQGKLVDAIRYLTRAEPLFREVSSLDNLGRVLLLKGELHLAEGQRDDGFLAFRDALSTFESIGNVVWQCRCLDDIAKFYFETGNDAAALKFLGRALHLAGSERSEIETVPFLLKFARLFRDHKQTERAAAFVEQAKQIAAKIEDDWLKAECLVAEARTLDRAEASAKRNELITSAVKHIQSALLKCEVKGRRAEYMHKVGELYGWLDNLSEARRWIEQAVREHEEIGDVAGMGNCLASLAALAHEEQSPAEAISILERLVAFCEGKPLYYHHAGALHDLGMLKLSQDDVEAARRCIEAASVIAQKHDFRDVMELLNGALVRLRDVEQSHQPPQRDFSSLIEALHAWCARYPKMRRAILPLWYYMHRSESWSICRSKLGVKFLVCANDPVDFKRVADSLRGQGDLFVWAIKFSVKTKPIAEWIPLPPDLGIPPSMTFAGMREWPENSEDTSKVLAQALDRSGEKYLLVPFSEPAKAYPGAKLFAFGRHIRLAPMISKMMLETPAKDLIADNRICLHLGEGEDALGLHQIMVAAWKNGAIPIFLKQLPHDDEIGAVCDSMLELPTCDAAPSVVAKEPWIKLLSSCSEAPNSSLANFNKEMTALRSIEPKGRFPVRAYMLRFQAGSQEVVHPVVVVV